MRYISTHPEIELMIRARMSRGRSAFSIWKSLCLVLGSCAPRYEIVLRFMKQQHKARISSTPGAGKAAARDDE
jgi:hypothetical protein